VKRSGIVGGVYRQQAKVDGKMSRRTESIDQTAGRTKTGLMNRGRRTLTFNGGGSSGRFGRGLTKGRIWSGQPGLIIGGFLTQCRIKQTPKLSKRQ